jgi:hypothetical protein
MNYIRHHPQSKTREHVVPRSVGGKNGGNIVYACQRCNAARSSDSYDDYMLFARQVLVAGKRKLHGDVRVVRLMFEAFMYGRQVGGLF